MKNTVNGSALVAVAMAWGALTIAMDLRAAPEGDRPLRGIWTSAPELQKAPTAGPAWETVLLAARADTSGPDISDQDDRTNTRVLAAAIAHARTGRPEFPEKCIAAIERLLKHGNPGGRTLAWARECGAYALAADFIEYRTPEFETWLRNVADKWVGDDGRTVHLVFSGDDSFSVRKGTVRVRE